MYDPREIREDRLHVGNVSLQLLQRLHLYLYYELFEEGLGVSITVAPSHPNMEQDWISTPTDRSHWRAQVH